MKIKHGCDKFFNLIIRNITFIDKFDLPLRFACSSLGQSWHFFGLLWMGSICLLSSMSVRAHCVPFFLFFDRIWIAEVRLIIDSLSMMRIIYYLSIICIFHIFYLNLSFVSLAEFVDLLCIGWSMDCFVFTLLSFNLTIIL